MELGLGQYSKEDFIEKYDDFKSIESFIVGEDTQATVYQACSGTKGAGNSMQITYPTSKENSNGQQKMNRLSMPIAFCVSIQST